ncbi:hypothetical protein B0H10DRAFT_1993719 [Mycena sp. CBHHK59/15]|nr:hypothetical protein B0H10DRAFT_1993719 [Mycena sp. CBHHK59/15]
MPPTPDPFDLKEVGALFNHCISKVRAESQALDLEPMAVEWLKAARFMLMKDIEKQYYRLANSAPENRPSWALDPAKTLIVYTENPPILLKPYFPAFDANLLALLHVCGFHATSSTHCSAVEERFYFHISFPAQLGDGATEHAAPRTLYVDDEFSRPADGNTHSGAKAVEAGPFMSSAFGRLLTAPPSTDSSGSASDGDPGPTGGSESGDTER